MDEIDDTNVRIIVSIYYNPQPRENKIKIKMRQYILLVENKEAVLKQVGQLMGEWKLRPPQINILSPWQL